MYHEMLHIFAGVIHPHPPAHPEQGEGAACLPALAQMLVKGSCSHRPRSQRGYNEKVKVPDKILEYLERWHTQAGGQMLGPSDYNKHVSQFMKK